ncbi:HlyD family secretion protein [Solimicrobium silvestre]|uniref:Multidrug resistance efflux pump n=1 Tax=Solimicrobium silvestre TaxID=2099400 RepID=A0A2S9GW14_9BURK|nr:efflux RND transporter periplasmic adaptor subunit [Solimicrobium silvestre]PRC91900.1 Multidrug resistance efflux pump [Solimicrobium silvestre]
MKKIHFIGAVIGLVVVTLLGIGLFQSTKPVAPVFQGQIEAREIDVAPKLPARVAYLDVHEGDQVEIGQVLLRLDSPEVAAKLQQANAVKDAAEALRDKANNGARPEERKMAELNWQRADAAAQLAKVSFERVNNLYKEGLLSQQKRDEAQTQWQTSQDAANAARAQADMANQGARIEDRAAASAQARQTAGVLAEVEAAQAETQLKAPVAGEVAKVLIRAGELAPTGVPLITIVDLSDTWMVLNVRETYLQRFAKGQEFDATIPALGNKIARFKVRTNAVLPDFATWRATRSNAGYDVRTFEIKAYPVNKVDGLRPGMSVLIQ